MKLIADSGSTKTKFALCDGKNVEYVLTDGINPFHQSKEMIESCIKSQLMPKISNPGDVRSIEFYGAGCTVEKRVIVEEVLKSVFPGSDVYVDSDLYGAAKALCGDKKGIACILGTGSNSCLFDGKSIVKNVSPLGYILGDEGSGAVLGKLLVADIAKNQAPADITEAFYKKYNTTNAGIIENVYRKPLANRYLASFAPFLSENIKNKYCYNLVYSSIRSFIERNVMQYPTDCPVHFTGSIAFYFKEVLEQVLSDKGLKLGTIARDPLELLCNQVCVK